MKATVYGIKANVLKEIKIPISPLAMQQTIVTKIEAEQRLINANKELILIFEDKKSKPLSIVSEEKPHEQRSDQFFC